MIQLDQWYTLSQAAKLVGVSHSTVYRIVKFTDKFKEDEMRDSGSMTRPYFQLTGKGIKRVFKIK